MLHRVAAGRRARARVDQGETLIEIIMTVAIVALTAVALIGSVLTSITSSGEHRTLALNDQYLKDYADSAAQQIQRQAAPLYKPCASVSYYNSNVTSPSNVPSSYTIGITGIKYWDTTSRSWSANCPSGTPAQLITVGVASPTQVAATLAFAVRSPT
jgi:type II secretory pathway pseudopilin PulG